MNEKKFIKNNIIQHDKYAKKYNSRHIEIYNSFEQSRLDSIIKSLIKKFNKKNIRVLDFGSGTRNLTNHFLRYKCNVTACDVSIKSLDLLRKRYNDPNLKTKLIKGKEIPFMNNSFDIVAIYSVLHHIPDYLFIVKELIRITKPGGFIYIDHEANKNKYFPNEELKSYYNITKRKGIKKITEPIKTGNIFKFEYIKLFLIRTFINRKYHTEGDIHVWPDDYIDWKKIYNIIKEMKCKIILDEDYLMFNPLVNNELYSFYSKKCSDTKYVIIKK